MVKIDLSQIVWNGYEIATMLEHDIKLFERELQRQKDDFEDICFLYINGYKRKTNQKPFLNHCEFSQQKIK